MSRFFDVLPVGVAYILHKWFNACMDNQTQQIPAETVTAPSPIPTTPRAPKHRVRTLFAALLGTIATTLILVSVLSVWVNKTLTDTDTYTAAVTPLVEQRDVQMLLANRLTSVIIDSSTANVAAEKLLSASQRSTKTPDELLEALRPTVFSTVTEVLQSPRFYKVWEQTNRTAHAQLLTQLRTGSKNLTIDLSPILTTTLEQLKLTRLAPLVAGLDMTGSDLKIDLTGSGIDKAHDYYTWVQNGIIGLVVVTILFALGAMVVSVNHLKTLRLMAIGTGILSVLSLVVIQTPSLITPSGVDADAQAAGLAVAKSLLKNLQATMAVIALICLGVAVAITAQQLLMKRARVAH